MSRTKRDILDTESMLQRLTKLLSDCLDRTAGASHENWRVAKVDAESLRRISMTLHRWHELECGDGNEHGSWAIARGRKTTATVVAEGNALKVRQTTFEHDPDGAPYFEHHHYMHGRGKDYVTYTKMPDREAGARKRLAAIMARYPALASYVQSDPRGCALYILRPGDVPAGERAESYYSRGLAVHS